MRTNTQEPAERLAQHQKKQPGGLYFHGRALTRTVEAAGWHIIQNYL
jgi:hypothetical protein